MENDCKNRQVFKMNDHAFIGEFANLNIFEEESSSEEKDSEEAFQQ